jgi:hypothetical protein
VGAGAAGAGAVAGEHLRKAPPLSSIGSPSGGLRTAGRGGRCADAPTRADEVWLVLLSYPAGSGDGSAEVFAGGDAEFGEHVAQVPLDGTGADVQLGGDLLVGVPVPGAPVEDTISIMHLITHGIPARYPDLKIINSHLGGALPMLLQRADDQYRWEAPDTPEPPSVAARRMWYDTVGHGHVPALRCAIDSFGADRLLLLLLLLGTDFPYEKGDIFLRAVDYINAPQIDPDAARAILDHNASALLRIGQERQGTASSSGETR